MLLSGSVLKFPNLPADLKHIFTAKCLSMDINLCADDVLWQFHRIVKDSVKFAVDDCFILDLLHEEEIPLFVEVKYIISTRGIYFLCGCIALPERFVSHLHAYQVRKTADWLVFEPGEQVDHHALDIYKDYEADVYYIPLRYKVTGTT